MKIKVNPVDLIYTDSKGVTHDTKKERIAKTLRFAELSAVRGFYFAPFTVLNFGVHGGF